VRSQPCSALSLGKLLALTNLVFWLLFAAFYLIESNPYKIHDKVFEEIFPAYIYFGRALPVLEERYGALMKATTLIQWPSFYAALPVNFAFSRRGIVVDQQYGAISAGGYYLLAVCMLSFVQWYLVGWIVQGVGHRWVGRQAHPQARDGSTAR
jgi:hypothetical protein